MMDKTFVILNWEMDWNDDNVYFIVTEEGKMVKYNVLTDNISEYEIEKVAQ